MNLFMKKIIHGLPATVKGIEEVEPVYEEMPGWNEDITNVKSFEELPVNCQNYIRRIEELIHCPIVMFSVGPDRNQMPGWNEDITNVKSFEELPVNCQNYIRRIEELIHCPIVMFSVGPDRNQTVVLKEIEF